MPRLYNSHLDATKSGDELYTASIIAIHAGVGTLAWYYQTMFPPDRWDFDSGLQKLARSRRFTLAEQAASLGRDAGGQEWLLLRARSWS